jgi:hypothetical protein
VKLLKKGDKIKMLRNAGPLKKGKIYTIDIVDENDSDCPYYVNNERWVCSDQFVPAYEFHVGQRVRIRSLESMEKEFGDDFRNEVVAGFVSEMDESCGHTATIKFFDGKYVSLDWDGGFESRWSYSTDMLEPAEEEKPKFKVGQIYRSTCDDEEKGNIVKITEVSERWINYNTIRGVKHGTMFHKNSAFATGLVLLTGKEIGEAIRKWDEEHSEKEPEYNEVKRHAKVGEYIKIVKAYCPKNYKNGDILLVTDEFSSTSVICKGARICICDPEYVVLEGYKPIEDKPKETKRQAKVGEFVRLIENGDAYTKDEVCEVIADGRDGDVYIRTKKNDNNFCGGCADRSIEQPFSFVGRNTYVVLEGYKPEQKGKHSYTESEVAEAKRIVLDTIREYAEKDEQIIISHIGGCESNNSFIARMIAHDTQILHIGNEFSFTSKYTTSKCSDTDEPNEWIGKAVALCKLLHKPIPDFIMGD